MSDATVVSIYPVEYVARFPGMATPHYIIPAAKEKDFVTVHIPDGHGFIPLTEGRPPLKQNYSGEQIASSIVSDLISTSMYVTETAFPGMKMLPGRHDKKSISGNFPELITALDAAQREWFSNWVKAADDIWSDPNARGKAQTISDLHRISAARLGLNREWITAQRYDQDRCPACTNFKPAEALVCPHCKTIVKPAEYDQLFKKAI